MFLNFISRNANTKRRIILYSDLHEDISDSCIIEEGHILFALQLIRDRVSTAPSLCTPGRTLVWRKREGGKEKGGREKEGGRKEEVDDTLNIHDLTAFGPAPQILPNKSSCGGPLVVIGVPSKKAAI